jgi:hypothetical protein
MGMAGAAIAAMAAYYVAFSGDAVSGFVPCHSGANCLNMANEFMPDRQSGVDSTLSPVIPVVDMDIGPANGGFFEFDQDFVGARFGYGNLFHPDSDFRFALYQGAHR